MNLATDHTACRQALLTHKAITTLLQLAESSKEASVREAALAIVVTLSQTTSSTSLNASAAINPTAVEELLDGRSLSFITKQITSSNQRMQKTVLNLLLILARDERGKERIGKHGGILAIVSLLSSTSADQFDHIETLALNLLVELARGNEENACNTVEAGGLSVLVDLLSANNATPSGNLQATRALVSLTSGAGAHHVSSHLIELGALEHLISLYHKATELAKSPSNNTSAASAASAANVPNITSDAVLSDEEALAAVAAAEERERQMAASSMSNTASQALETSENVVAILANLAQHGGPIAREQIFNSGEVESFLQLIASRDSERLPRAAARLVRYLASDPAIRSPLASVGVLPPVQLLLQLLTSTDSAETKREALLAIGACCAPLDEDYLSAWDFTDSDDEKLVGPISRLEEFFEAGEKIAKGVNAAVKPHPHVEVLLQAHGAVSTLCKYLTAPNYELRIAVAEVLATALLASATNETARHALMEAAGGAQTLLLQPIDNLFFDDDDNSSRGASSANASGNYASDKFVMTRRLAVESLKVAWCTLISEELDLAHALGRGGGRSASLPVVLDTIQSDFDALHAQGTALALTRLLSPPNRSAVSTSPVRQMVAAASRLAALHVLRSITRIVGACTRIPPHTNIPIAPCLKLRASIVEEGACIALLNSLLPDFADGPPPPPPTLFMIF